MKNHEHKLYLVAQQLDLLAKRQPVVVMVIVVPPPFVMFKAVLLLPPVSGPAVLRK